MFDGGRRKWFRFAKGNLEEGKRRRIGAGILCSFFLLSSLWKSFPFPLKNLQCPSDKMKAPLLMVKSGTLDRQKCRFSSSKVALFIKRSESKESQQSCIIKPRFRDHFVTKPRFLLSFCQSCFFLLHLSFNIFHFFHFRSLSLAPSSFLLIPLITFAQRNPFLLQPSSFLLPPPPPPSS